MTPRDLLADLNERFPCGTLSIVQLMYYLQCSRRTVMRMIYDKQIMGKKVRGQWRFTPLAIANYMSSRR